MLRNKIFNQLETSAGIVFPMAVDFIPKPLLKNHTLAMDAQPQIVTVANNGIPAYLANYLDPKLIEVLLTPIAIAEIIGGDSKKGDWVTLTAQFPVVESTGLTSSYDDFSEDGSAGANVDFPTFQSYHYQIVSQWGERQLEMASLAKIDWAQRLNIAAALALNKFQNKMYAFGISGLQNYGLLNSPNLITPISPTAAWSTLDGAGVYEDCRRLFAQLQTQLRGNVTTMDKMTLAMSPILSVNLNKTNTFNVNVMDQLKKNFPNLTVKAIATEYSTTGGELMQLIVDEIEGQRTAEALFTEKMRAHRIIPAMSSFKQKKTQGGWGTVIYRPIGIAQMLGM